MKVTSVKSALILLLAILGVGMMSACTTMKSTQNSTLQQKGDDAGDEHILWGRY